MAGGYVPTAEQKAADRRDVEDVLNRLAKNAEGYAKQFLSGGVKAGNCYQAASIDGGKGRSFVLWIGGPKQGEYFDFSAGPSGNMLDFLAHHEFKGNWGDAIKHYKSEFGLDDKDPARVAKRHREVAVLNAKKEKERSAEIKAKASRAQHLWLGAVPIKGTPAQAYLEQRGIDFAALGKIPGVLRYRPDVKFCPIRGAGPDGTGYPAMLAAVYATHPDMAGQQIAVHATFLDISGWDHARKAGPVRVHKVVRAESVHDDGKVDYADAVLFDPANPIKGKMKSHKATLGSYGGLGGYIPLWKGRYGCGLRELPVGAVPWFGEGIENSLSRVMAFPGDWTAAAVTLSNLGAIFVPDQVDQVGLIMDHAEPGSPASVAQEAAIARWQERLDHAEAVLLDLPKVGFKDHNDALRGISAQSNTLGQSK